MEEEENTKKTVTNHERVLFENYFNVIQQKENNITAACRFCGDVFMDSSQTRPQLQNHLKVSFFSMVQSPRKMSFMFCSI